MAKYYSQLSSEAIRAEIDETWRAHRAIELLALGIGVAAAARKPQFFLIATGVV
jgi:hypothetical protein